MNDPNVRPVLELVVLSDRTGPTHVLLCGTLLLAERRSGLIITLQRPQPR